MIDLFATRFLLGCLGITLVLTGTSGLTHPQLFKTYLAEPRCFVLIMLGVVTLVFHYRRLDWLTRLFAGLCASAFGVLSWFGLQYGVPATRKIGVQEPDSQLWSLWDGRFELGHNDHRLHMAVAILFLVAAIAPRAWEPSFRPVDSKSLTQQS